jgi:hypothetical protein
VGELVEPKLGASVGAIVGSSVEGIVGSDETTGVGAIVEGIFDG